MEFRRAFGVLVAGLILATSAAIVVTQRTVATSAARRPWWRRDAPAQWLAHRAGRPHFPIGDLPLAMALSPDGHSLVVTNDGYQRPTLRVLDLDRQTVSTVALDDAWLGLAWHPDGTRLFSSGAASNTVQELAWANGRLRAGAKYNVAKTAAPVRGTARDRLQPHRRSSGASPCIPTARGSMPCTSSASSSARSI